MVPNAQGEEEKKIVEKLALHEEEQHLAKEAMDAKAHIALLSKILESKFGGNIALFLSSCL